MEDVITGGRPAAPYAVALGDRLHLASDDALGELTLRLGAVRDDLRDTRPGRSWHETVALVDLVIAAVDDEIRRRPAAG